MTALPSGSETGLVLAVDLGGTNCRVCSVELHGDSTYTVRKLQQAVPRDLRINSSYKPLFKFIASQIRTFLETQHTRELRQRHRKFSKSEGSQGKLWKLGFVFSFTYIQKSLTKGEMIHWDKDWEIPEAIGRDPCEMLQEAINELDLPIYVAALANDSVGALMARAYTAGRTDRNFIGAIFGTGTNAAYVERLENIKKLDCPRVAGQDRSSDFMVVNTEWGDLDNDIRVLPRISYDDLLDKESTHPGEQALEKRIAGLYLAELLRLILWSLWKKNLFAMTLSEDSPLLRREGLDSALLSEMANTSKSQARRFLSLQFKATGMTDLEASVIQSLGAVIVRRSARLAGIAFGATILLSCQNVPGAANRNAESSHVGKERRANRTRSGISEVNTFPKRAFEFFWSCLYPKKQPRNSKTFKSLQSEPKTTPDREQTIDVGVDGSLIRHYPDYQRLIRETLRSLVKVGPAIEARVEISFVEDGSAVGAALAALSSSLTSSDTTQKVPHCVEVL